ncbi:lipid kinase [Anaeromyxobacter sp. K]|uniref:lipid kinase n=1 Tax=Anaeromyxobacter sp. (strain K) TaxID=447217 RepID=UPI00015F92A0|nr:lipid kinase [Anaeromyxobacter sp. K]
MARRAPAHPGLSAGGEAVLLVNAAARKGDAALSAARAALEAAGVVLAEALVVEPGGLTERVEAAVAAGAGRVIVGGGDGSLAAAASALAGTGAALGVLPLGTANDFARTLGIPDDLARAGKVIARGRVRRGDVGWAGRRAFLNAASVGASSELTRRLDDGLKRRAGTLAYPVAGAAAAGQPPFRARLEVDGRTEDLHALQVVVGNGRYHGGGRLIAPRARADDHLLDVYVLTSASSPGAPRLRDRLRDLAGLARYALLLLRGRHLEHPGVLHVRATRASLWTDPPLDIDADGELAGSTPAEFRVAPGQLAVLAP